MNLEKMTIAQLRNEFPNIPKKFRKKDEIILFLSSADSAEPPAPTTPKNTITSYFGPTSSVFQCSICKLCTNERFIWTELGRAFCPLCRAQPARENNTHIKLENESNSILSTTISGELMFHIEGAVTKEGLVCLVLQYGFGVIESIEALISANNNTETAACKLIDCTRSAADSYCLAQAQLNSEEALTEQRANSKTNIQQTRANITDDISLFTLVDQQFASEYLFNENGNDQLLLWTTASPNNPQLLYDYLLLKKDAIKWYKADATLYFQRIEEQELLSATTHHLSQWFSNTIVLVKEAMYSIPDNGGSIPSLFRARDKWMGRSDDGDLELVEDAVMRGGKECLVQLD